MCASEYLMITPHFSAHIADKLEAMCSKRRSEALAQARAAGNSCVNVVKGLRGPCWTGMKHVWRMRRPDGADILILGETHMAPPGPTQSDVEECVRKSSDHGIYGLLEYLAAAKSEAGGANLYAEMSPRDRANLVLYSFTSKEWGNAIGKAQWDEQSNSIVAKQYSTSSRLYNAMAFNQDFAGQEDVAMFYCNVRESEVFFIFNALCRSDRFAEECMRHSPHYEARDGRWRELMKRLVLKMEQSFGENVKSQEDMLGFWEDMVLPERTTPPWYSEISAGLFGLVAEDNDLKAKLADLRMKDSVAYSEVTGFFFEVMKQFLLGGYGDGDGAAASERRHACVLEKLRRRKGRYADTNAETMRDQRPICEYFAAMLALIKDLYTCVRYELERDSSENHVFLVGNLHSRYLCWYLEKREGAKFYGWSSDESAAVPAVNVTGPARAVSEDPSFYSVDRMMQEYIDDPSPATGDSLMSQK